MPRVLLVAILVVAACTVPATNPLDPKAPLSEQTKASVTGTVVLLDEGASVAGVTVGLLDVDRQPVRGADGQVLQALVEGTKARGTFTLAGIQPGQYAVSFKLDPRFRAPFVPRFTLSAGETLSLGELDFSVQEAGTGQIRGRAALIDAAGGARTIGVFRRRSGRPPELVRQLTTDANGLFDADSLPPGTYAVSAEATGFFPDFSTGHALWGETSAGLSSNEIVLEGEDELRLYPATAVLVPDLPRKGSTYFTNDDAIELLVIPTVVDAWVTDMRLSSDRAFHADNEEMSFGAFRQRASVSLPAEEGVVPIYGQFRAKAGDFDFTTDVFETQVVRDVTPPAFVATSLRGVNATDGIAWLREDGATVTVEIQANDVASAVSAYGVYMDSANEPGVAEAVTFHDVSVPPGFVRIDHTTQLLPGQGPQVLGLWLRDHAGNISGPERLEVVVDSQPPVLDGPLKVVNADQQAQLDGRVAILKIPVEEICRGEDAAPGQCAVEFRYGTAPLPTNGFFSPFELDEDGTVAVQVSGGNGQSVGFEVQLRDPAGNVATYTSELYTLRLLGQLSGRALVEGYPDDSSAHGGALVELFEPGGERTSAIATATTGADGLFVLRTADDESVRLPAGHYTVVVSRGDLEPFEAETAVRENESAVLPAYRLTPARGGLRGRFVRADQATSNRAHANIEVTASRNGIVVARTVTTDDGSYSFPAPGLPVTVGGERYTLLASASGYAARRVEGIEVFRAETTIAESDGGTPPEAQAVELARLAGDFVFCEALTDPCVPTPYSNKETVRIMLLEATGVSEIRFRARTPFAADAATPDWLPFDADTPYLVDIADSSDPDGSVTVYVQTQIAGSAGPVLSASVLLDREAPELTSFEIEPGPNALAGFTSKLTVRAVVGADPGEGDVAPLQTALVSFASTPPTAPAAGSVACTFGAPCTIPLPATLEEKSHVAYAFACDRAGNCSTTPLTARIVYDVTPPRQANGLAFEPAATWITKADGIWYSRAGRIDVGLDVGTAQTPAGETVLDPDGAPVPDVVAYRFGLRMDVADGTWQTLSDTTLPEAHMTTQALELTGEDGRYEIYAQFRDAAGNVTRVENNPHTFAITVDRLPPAVAFTVNGGAEWTNYQQLQLSVTTASGDIGPARDVMLSRDGGLFETFEKKTLPLVGSDATYTLPGIDGSYSLYARFSDAAGNVSDRVARIYLDRTPPRIVSLKCGTCREDPATGAVYTTNRQAILDFVASDNSGAIASVTTQVGTSPASSGGYTGTVTATLVDTDGPQPIKVFVTDPAGNVSQERTLTVVLDRTEPDIEVQLNEGDEYTTSASVVIDIANKEGSALSGLRVSNTATFSGPVQPFTSRIPWRLSNPTDDGPRTVYVEVTDPAGNVTEDSAEIILDTHAPSAPTLLITEPSPIGSANALTNANITLRISTNDGTRPLDGAAVLLEGDVAQTGGSTGWNNVGSNGLTFGNGHFEWTGSLSAAEGPKQLSVRVRDAAGNVSDASIVRALLRTGAPSDTFASIAESPVTASTIGTVYLSAHGATELRLAGDIVSVAGRPGSVDAWLPFTTTVPVVFDKAGGDGLKTVTVTFRNEAELESTPIAATTTLDQTPPSIPRFIGLPVAQPEINLTLNIMDSIDAQGGPVRYEWLNPRLSGWTTVTFPTDFDLSDNTSTTFRVRAVDEAGNVSAEDVATVLHDNEAPPAPIVVTPSLYVAAQTTSVTLTGGEVDENFSHYKTCTVLRPANESCSSDLTCSFARTSSSFALSLAANQNTCLGAVSVDTADNESEITWTQILSDTQRPVPPVIGPPMTRDSFVVGAQEIEVAIHSPGYDPPAGDDTRPWANIAYVEFSYDGNFAPLCPDTRKDGKWAPCDPEATGGRCTDYQLRCRGTEISAVVMPLEAGKANTLSARAVDLAGNVGDVVSIEIRTPGSQPVTTMAGRERSPFFFGSTLGFTSVATGNMTNTVGNIIELGSDRTYSSTAPQCEVSDGGGFNRQQSFAIGRPGAVYPSGTGVRMRVRGTDGLFCTGDDSFMTLDNTSSKAIYLALGGETAGWADEDSAVNDCAPIQLREPGANDLLDGVGDATVTLPYRVPVGFLYSERPPLQIAEDVLVVNPGSCSDGAGWVLVHRRETGALPYSYVDGVTWAFDAASAALSPDGRLLVTTSGWGEISIRERGPDKLFGTEDDRVSSVYTGAWFNDVNTDGLRIVASQSNHGLFSWSPGLDGVFDSYGEAGSDDKFSWVFPSSGTGEHVAVSKGLVVHTDHDNLSAIDLAQMRWETNRASEIYFPMVVSGGLVYRYAGSDGNGRGPIVKIGADESHTNIDNYYYGGGPSSLYASGDDAVYKIVDESTVPRTFRLYGRKLAINGSAFGPGDAVSDPILEVQGDESFIYPFGIGDGKALAISGLSYSDMQLYVIEPGNNGLADGHPVALSYALSPTPNDIAGISRRYVAWRDSPYGIHVWQAGPDETFGTSDDVPPAPLKKNAYENYAAPEVAHAGSRIAIRDDYWNAIHVVEAGNDKTFNTADDVHFDVPVQRDGVCGGSSCNLSMAGDFMAWVGTDISNGTEQVFLYDFHTKSLVQVTNHTSLKKHLHLTDMGRLLWVDEVFPYSSVFSFVP